MEIDKDKVSVFVKKDLCDVLDIERWRLDFPKIIKSVEEMHKIFSDIQEILETWAVIKCLYQLPHSKDTLQGIDWHKKVLDAIVSIMPKNTFPKYYDEEMRKSIIKKAFNLSELDRNKDFIYGIVKSKLRYRQLKIDNNTVDSIIDCWIDSVEYMTNLLSQGNEKEIEKYVDGLC